MIFEFIRASLQGAYFIVTLTYPGPCEDVAPPWAVEGLSKQSFYDVYSESCIVRYRASQELPEYYRGLDLPRENNKMKQYWAALHRSEPYYVVLYINGMYFE